MRLSFFLSLLLLLLSSSFSFALAANGTVTYDHRSLIINGQRKLLISASIHYPRSVPSVRKAFLVSISVLILFLTVSWIKQYGAFNMYSYKRLSFSVMGLFDFLILTVCMSICIEIVIDCWVLVVHFAFWCLKLVSLDYVMCGRCGRGWFKRRRKEE